MDQLRLLDVLEDVDARLAEQSRRLDRLETELALVVDANRQAQVALIELIEPPPSNEGDFDDFDEDNEDDGGEE